MLFCKTVNSFNLDTVDARTYRDVRKESENAVKAIIQDYNKCVNN